MIDKPQFQASKDFLDFFLRVKGDNKLRKALIKEDFSSIYVTPGLTEKERNFLKIVNWKEMEVIADEQSAPLEIEAGAICEEKIGPAMIERKCEWPTGPAPTLIT